MYGRGRTNARLGWYRMRAGLTIGRNSVRARTNRARAVAMYNRAIRRRVVSAASRGYQRRRRR